MSFKVTCTPVQDIQIPIQVRKWRCFMSTTHCTPQSSISIFKDMSAKKTVATHWGTDFDLGYGS
ncbi:hypothetical protein IW261DRAFT_1608775 [Armillaria novae-zelandiae]|uniref:Uncharacterized protein n=1 Tax=Armillaria novae-zelandiae TaxID=153914 RepID=A0AA39P6G7_9AGAR|nr:hypothetical protein IW261DRAFT_1608775 [Armillaria novae-zelandiae]